MPKDAMNYLDDGRVTAASNPDPLWVIPKDLCTRCGACSVVCPTNVVHFDDHQFPYIEPKNCIDCGLCLKVCPGIEYDLEGEYQAMFDQPYPTDHLGGEIQQAYVGYSNKPDVRAAGAAGGVVTHMLISMLNNGTIDGAVVIGNNPDDPVMPEPMIARTEQELRDAAQSKYSTLANTKVLRGLRGSDEKFAFVGVGCQIHGLKKLEKLNKRLEQRISLVIGLACRGTLEREAIEDMLAAQNIAPDDLDHVSHRGGAFPGKFQAHYRDGVTRDLHHFEYKNAAYTLMHKMYLPERCHLCPDYSAEFSDITCSDLWLRGADGKYLHQKGATLILCRTERGVAAIEALREQGALTLEPISKADVERSYGHLRREKKVMPFMLVNEREAQGKRAPEYHIDPPIPAADVPFLQRYRRTFALTHYHVLRRMVMQLIFSPLGAAVVFLNIQWKVLRAKRKARRTKIAAPHPQH